MDKFTSNNLNIMSALSVLFACSLLVSWGVELAVKTLFQLG